MVERLVRNLGKGPWKVFFDPRIGAGMEWNEELLRELRNAQCVLVLWSAASRRSFWVRAEAAPALGLGTYLPVCLDEEPPPTPFPADSFLGLSCLSFVRFHGVSDGPPSRSVAASSVALYCSKSKEYGPSSSIGYHSSS